jgi:hypothetical protein
MEPGILDSTTLRLLDMIGQRGRFQARYDARAGEFLPGLPGLFRLFHWLTFDLEVAPEHRRKAASIAVYIAEAHDYCGESNLGVEGLIDDLWLAYTAVHQLAKALPVPQLQRHWRSELTLFQVLDLSRATQDLEQHVPSRVLERLQDFVA